jgi:hypothetical protein
MGPARNGLITALASCCALVMACASDVSTAPIEENTLSDHGEDCAGPEDCLQGLICASDGTCLYPGEPGTAGEGDDCDGTTFCQFGLVCDHDGECAPAGSAGTAGDGEECESDEDCQVMLQCLDGECRGFQVPLWHGAECAEPGEGAFRVHFEVPGETPLDEFYRLPFPNDARRVDGGLDLSGHPSPGGLIPQVGDVVGEVIDASEADLDAFGNNQAVLMRFSDEVDYGTLVMDDPGVGTLYILDVTTFSGDFGTRRSGAYRTSGDRGLYICPNWISFTPSDGRPYEPGHTYAAVITTGVQSRDGEPAAQDDDFTAMLAATTPADDRLEHAWDAYEPLRRWIDEAGTDPASLAAAAVFTVQRPGDRVAGVRDAVYAADEPVVDGMILCQEGDPGPYAGGSDPDRGCDGVHPDFHEIQGTVRLPRFQEGTPPYKMPAHGGALTDEPVDYDDVVFALTVPNDATMPLDGWPLVLFGHGTGGNYRTFVTQGVAERLAAGTLDDGGEIALAVLSIDAVLHGPRAAEESWDEGWLAVDPSAYDPAVLFFNVLNPRAARDNPLQAAADTFGLVRLAQALDWDAAGSPTGEALRFDPDRLLYAGHSQGSSTGVGFAAAEDQLHAATFAGAGGLLIESLLNRTQPHDTRAALKVTLADPDLDRHHPVLNLIQALGERSDPINHAATMVHDPLDDSPVHVLHQVGLGDESTPDVTQAALARALYLDQVTNGHAPLDHLAVVSPPVAGNVSVDSAPFTAVATLHQPDAGADAQAVIFALDEAMRQMDQFLGSAMLDDLPTVVEP